MTSTKTKPARQSARIRVRHRTRLRRAARPGVEGVDRTQAPDVLVGAEGIQMKGRQRRPPAGRHVSLRHESPRRRATYGASLSFKKSSRRNCSCSSSPSRTRRASRSRFIRLSPDWPPEDSLHGDLHRALPTRRWLTVPRWIPINATEAERKTFQDGYTSMQAGLDRHARTARRLPGMR